MARKGINNLHINNFLVTPESERVELSGPNHYSNPVALHCRALSHYVFQPLALLHILHTCPRTSHACWRVRTFLAPMRALGIKVKAASRAIHGATYSSSLKHTMFAAMAILP